MPPGVNIFIGQWPIDEEWLFNTIKASYWGARYTRNSLLEATERSLCFSAVIRGGSDNAWMQVGFARVVTDGAISSIVNDVIVDEKWRHQGIGRALLERIFAHPHVSPTICILQCRPENSDWYAKFGFVPVDSMHKRDPR